MSVKTELLTLIESAAKRFDLPLISQLYIPEPHIDKDNTEFGVVALEDGSAGLYYAWLGETQKGMQERYADHSLIGRSAIELARYFNNCHEADRSIGLASINAITQSIYMRAGFIPETAGDSLGSLVISPGDHLGMIGYFPSLIRQLRDYNVKVTVIEKKEKFVNEDKQVKITLDPNRLKNCNKILSTATILLNDTVDTILALVNHAECVTIIGPTAGFFPDPLFKRGVTAIGGTIVINAVSAIDRINKDEHLGDAVRKYIITRDNYPGIEELFQRIQN